MKMLTKILGIFLIVFSFALYNAAPLQRGHGHGRGHGYGHGPKKTLLSRTKKNLLQNGSISQTTETLL